MSQLKYLNLETVALEILALYYLSSEQQRRWSYYPDAQADLSLCCSHKAEDMFSHDVLMNWI